MVMGSERSAVVLIVSGDVSRRDTLTGILEPAGWQVWKVETAAEARELVKSCPRVIVLDLASLELSAQELCRELKMDSLARTVPVLRLGQDSVALDSSMLDSEPLLDAYLANPIDPYELVAAVKILARLNEAEASAELSRSKLEAITAHLTEGVIMTDQTGRFLSMNPAALRMHGFSSVEAMPVSVDQQDNLFEYAFLDGTIVPHADRPSLRAARGEIVGNVELRVRRRDTEKLWIGSYSARRVQPEDVTSSVIVIVNDITDRKDSEKALRKAQSDLATSATDLEKKIEERTSSLREAINQMEEFSYTVSHDLRAPLRSIKGYAEILMEDHRSRMKAEGLRYLERIVENGERMERLVNDVLTISRISNTKVKLGRVVTQSVLEAVVREHANLQQGVARVSIEPLPNVLGHESLCIQVFSNLLSNAAKFVKPGTLPQIRVWAERVGGVVTINVKDNGIGISPEYHQKIFGMFERLDPNNRYSGTGIGLAIVRKAVEKMNGRVGVESVGQSGSRFWVELPAWTGEK